MISDQSSHPGFGDLRSKGLGSGLRRTQISDHDGYLVLDSRTV